MFSELKYKNQNENMKNMEKMQKVQKAENKKIR